MKSAHRELLSGPQPKHWSQLLHFPSRAPGFVPLLVWLRPISHSPGHPGCTTSVSQAGSSPQEGSTKAENPEPALTTPPGFTAEGQQHWKGLLMGTVPWADRPCRTAAALGHGLGWRRMGGLPFQGLSAAHLGTQSAL